MNLIAFRGRVFLHHHRIRARRNRRAGEDSRRGAFLERLADRAGHYFLSNAQARPIARSYGEPIHGAVIHRRHVHGRALRAREDAVRGLECRYLLDLGDRLRFGEQPRERVVDGQEALIHFRMNCTMPSKSLRSKSGNLVSTLTSLATATMCGSFGCSSPSPVSARHTSSLGIGACLKPSTSSRSQGEMRFTCSSNEGSCAPRSSCISTQRRDEVTMVSDAPAWRWR